MLSRLLILAGTLLAFDAAASAPVQLYRDSVTGQVFAEPGPGRQPLGPIGTVAVSALESKPAKAAWYDKLSLRGYMQLRYNQELNDGADALRSPGDRFIGEDQAFGIRRMRVILSGNVSDRLSLYIQPDFASTPGGSSTGNFAQLRDAYADLYLDEAREHRLRAGQSKVPYGFENLQSSSNRLTPDRADALNSAVRDERDLGLFYYYAPRVVADRFSRLVKDGLKGSGDYGLMFGLGVYNGQGPNRSEGNDQVHTVLHSSYPMELASGQIIEFGVDAYQGRFVTPFSSISVDGATFTPNAGAPARGYRDERVAMHFVVYPQPLGLQGEWTVGRGPELNLDSRRVEVQSLSGGYLQAMYQIKSDAGVFFPYVKVQTYRGAAKFDSNAPTLEVDELEAGIEWQIRPEVELVAAFSDMERSNVSRAPYAREEGELLRLQLQINY